MRHNKKWPDEAETGRIVKAWQGGEMTLNQMARRFDRSRDTIAAIIRNSGALKNERGGKPSAAYSPDAPDARPAL